MRCLLTPGDGTFLLTPVNASYIPHLLAEGEIKGDVTTTSLRRVGNPRIDKQRERVQRKWTADKNSGGGDEGGGAQYRQELFLTEVRSAQEKHMYTCVLKDHPKHGESIRDHLQQGPGKGPWQADKLECESCLSKYSYPEGFPEKCPSCSAQLERFALS